MENRQSNSGHILNASANLVGLCFIALTSLKVFKLPAESLIDDISAGALLLFTISTILSYLSLRTTTKRGEDFEHVAEYIFLTGLVLILAMTLLLTYNVIE
jgi:hypothetical protein